LYVDMRALGTGFLNTLWRPQEAIRSNQRALAEAQLELSTQRWHDVPLRLGSQTGRNITWHAELAGVENDLQTLNVSGTQAEISQNSLNALRELANNFVGQLVASRSASNGQELMRNQASHALSALQQALNVELSGVHLFAGRNQDKPPLPGFEGSPAQTQVRSEFLSQFGMAADDPAATNIPAAQLAAWLGGGYADLYETPNWEAGFSSASSDIVSIRAGSHQSVALLQTANAEPLRMLHAGFAAMRELSTGQLNQTAFTALVDTVMAQVSSAVQGLGDMQAAMASAQNMLGDAEEGLKVKKSWLSKAIAETESVDSYEVAARINGLMTQLEASYSVTGRIARLTLLNYL
jgi:flagellar hook-associated protein 3 FlgL